MTTTTQASVRIPGYVAGTWAIDPVHSDVSFRARHMMVAKVRGRFNSLSGQIVTTPELFGSSVTAEIDMTSVDTGNQRRDNHLRSPDFFDVDNHPSMTYRSTGLTVDGTDLFLEGQLTLKGITRSVPLALDINGFATDPNGTTVAGITATGTINRTDFGVDFELPLPGSSAGIADKIIIDLEIEATLTTPRDS